MILSRARRYIFIHIPKTGGTALTLALEARAARDDIIVADTPKAKARKGRLKGVQTAGRLWKHATLSDIRGLATDAEIATFFTLTLVRNPWDRVVSYYHWLRSQGFAHPAVALARSHDFSAFLNHPQTVESIRRWPFGAYLRDGNGEERASLMARIEALEEDLVPFEAHLGFRLSPLPRANASERPRDWRGLYTDRDAELVATICSDDIARFGYRFDP